MPNLNPLLTFPLAWLLGLTVALVATSMKYRLEFPGFSLFKIFGVSLAAAIAGIMAGYLFGLFGIAIFTEPPHKVVTNQIAVLDLFAHFGCLVLSWYFSMWAFGKYPDLWIKKYASQ